MAHPETVAVALRQRLEELTLRVQRTETELREPLDPDFEEQAVDLEDHDTLEALDSAGRQEIRRIEGALSRISAGLYGTCATCGGPIAPKRLEALPTAIQCIDCAP